MPVTLRAAQPEEVFNLSLYDSFIVVDCRTSEQYQKARLVTSFSCPPPPVPFEHASSALFDAFCELVGSYLPEHFSPIVLVHDEGEASQLFVAFLAQQIVLHLERSLPSTEPLTATSRNRQYFLQRLSACAEVWTLDFAAFAAKFPFLCDPALHIMALEPTPRFICEGFMACTRGRREAVIAAVRNLGITHVVTHHDPALLGELDEMGTAYVVYHVPDSLTLDLTELWTSCARVVVQLRTQGARVLLRVNGKSMSSSCAVAYLVGLGWDCEDALRHVGTAYRISVHRADDLHAWARAFADGRQAPPRAQEAITEGPQ